jgi:hypothetical protein
MAYPYARKSGSWTAIPENSPFPHGHTRRLPPAHPALAPNRDGSLDCKRYEHPFRPLNVETLKRQGSDRTEYLISIDDKGENDALSLKELDTLMAAPRIPKAISRYLQHQAAAAVESFKQGGCEDDLPF